MERERTIKIRIKTLSASDPGIQTLPLLANHFLNPKYVVITRGNSQICLACPIHHQTCGLREHFQICSLFLYLHFFNHKCFFKAEKNAIALLFGKSVAVS